MSTTADREEDIRALLAMVEYLATAYAGEYGHDRGPEREVLWALYDEAHKALYRRLRDEFPT